MKFETKGVDATHPELQEFRRAWMEATEQENMLVTGKPAPLSAAQRLVIDLFTNHDSGYRHMDGEVTMPSINPGQVEFEAIVRGRNRALAEAFHRSNGGGV